MALNPLSSTAELAPSLTVSRINAALKRATDALLEELGAEGYWEGELSSSALSTATAITALATVDRKANAALIAGGLRWLAENRNDDGGWGDTVRSRSNISTTALCWAAFGAAQADQEYAGVVSEAESWLAGYIGVRKLTPDALAAAIAARYGKDRTFSVPILMMCALSGRLGPKGWQEVMPLPFELAALPHQLFGALQLPVVSYALPALIAIGQTIHHHAPTRNPIARVMRWITKRPTLKVLESIQPPNGGFLEATPLTSFVTMSLAAMGLREERVVRRGVTFLKTSVRPDGSWPIDTNLATWTSTLAIKALSHQPGALKPEQRLTLREWLLGQQYRVEHPYTHAAPGGWAWTDLPGGVPDADDTPGALLALLHLGTVGSETQAAGQLGVRWLLGLQNRDGGIPTFCRGWGALPFDRSSPDLTAHTLRAWSAWLPQLDEPLKRRTISAIHRGLAFLRRSQRDDGSWLPLWFGNENARDDENPTYGTAQVLTALRELKERGFKIPGDFDGAAARWLVRAQNVDGSWGGFPKCPASVEETALALEALAGTEHVGTVDRGTAWLVEQVEAGTWREIAPIGFYFAKLWYFEKLYPLIFSVSALGRVAALRGRGEEIPA
ncbi:prenyltransferase/squalene oxidase repeat-containing protein [Verrucomicrobiota bacterium sgz303538]